MSKTFDIEEVLRSLRADGCHMWPNKYYMWTGKDGELVMVGLRSHLFWHILCYEEFANGETKTSIIDISPHRVHEDHSRAYDPIKRLGKRVSRLKYIGEWTDPDELIESPACYTKEIAAARWSLAKSEIFKKGNIRPTRKLWGRFGADIDLTEEEYNQIVGKGVKTKNKMATATIVEKAFKEGRVTLRGETYFPEKKCFSSYEEYNNPDQEICCEI